MSTRPPQLGPDLVWAEYFAPPRPAPALFLDRDGVIVEEVHYLHRIEQTRLIPGAIDCIRAARAADWHVVVVTNQSGIGRGIFGWADYIQVHDHILADLSAAGAQVDAVIACPHAPGVPAPYGHDDHPARKPNPGMLLEAAAELEIDLARSWIVGDRADDIEAGRNAGLTGGVHVTTGFGPAERPDALAHRTADFQVLTASSIAEVPALISGL